MSNSEYITQLYVFSVPVLKAALFGLSCLIEKAAPELIKAVDYKDSSFLLAIPLVDEYNSEREVEFIRFIEYLFKYTYTITSTNEDNLLENIKNFIKTCVIYPNQK